MNVILFKKQDENDKYNDVLLQHNYKPQFIPVLEHQLNNIDSIKRLLYNGPKKEQLTGLILTSQRSVEAIETCIKEPFEPQVIAEWKNLPIYVVGSHTAKALSNLFPFKDSHNWIIQPKALDLIKYFPKEQPSQENYLFLAGDKRRDVIPETLDKLHLNYIEIQSYSTCIHSQLKSNLQLVYQQKNRIDWLVLFSPSGLQFILDAIQDDKKLLMYYFSNKIASIGPTTTDFIQKIQQENKIDSHLIIKTAEKPDPPHLLKAMK